MLAGAIGSEKEPFLDDQTVKEAPATVPDVPEVQYLS
jgi:hypothetical protein